MINRFNDKEKYESVRNKVKQMDKRCIFILKQREVKVRAKVEAEVKGNSLNKKFYMFLYLHLSIMYI